MLRPFAETIPAVTVAGSPTSGTATALRSLDGGFGIDVHHTGLKLFGNIRKLIGELLRCGHRQGSGVRRLFCLLALDSVRDDGSHQDTNGQRDQNSEGV